MTIQQALLNAEKKFRKVRIYPALLDAEVLLASILRKPRAYLHTYLEQKLSANQQKKYLQSVAKRLRGMPVAYLTNHREFYKLDFIVDRRVLIPRPETELLVEEAISHARNLQHTFASEKPPKKITIADVGTGSGCIAVTLAKYLPFAAIVASDISKDALTIARKNAAQHKVLKRIKFLRGSLLKPYLRSRPDIIVANLPYLTADELAKIKHEPQLALNGGKMGIELIEQLITQFSQAAPQPGVLLLEISPSQKKIVEHIVRQHLPDRVVTFSRDLAQRDRVAVIK